MLRSPLAHQQVSVYRFLRAFTQRHGYPPTFREIADHFALAGASGVVCHLVALRRHGLIRRAPNNRWTITVPNLPQAVSAG